MLKVNYLAIVLHYGSIVSTLAVLKVAVCLSITFHRMLNPRHPPGDSTTHNSYIYLSTPVTIYYFISIIHLLISYPLKGQYLFTSTRLIPHCFLSLSLPRSLLLISIAHTICPSVHRFHRGKGSPFVDQIFRATKHSLTKFCI